MMSEEEQWLSYISLLEHHELHALNQFYFKDRKLQKIQLSRALFKILHRDDFLDKKALELDHLDRKILASIYSRPCGFSVLKERLSTSLNPVKLGVRLALLRSKLLLLGRKEGYKVFNKVAEKLELSFFDIVDYEKKPQLKITSQRPWLNENLLLAVASALLSQKRTPHSSFGNLFAAKHGEKRWQLILNVVLSSGLLAQTDNGYQPCLIDNALLKISLEQRLWYYWGCALKLTAQELHTLLNPFRHLPCFSQETWLSWLKHLLPEAEPTLTEKIINLNLLESDGTMFRINAKLDESLENELHSILVTSTGEFHLQQARLELAPLILASSLQNYNVVSLYKLELPLLKKVWHLYQGDNSFDFWYETLQKQQISLDDSLYQYLKICYQDSQKLLFFQTAPVLCCSSGEQQIIMNLPGIEEHIIHQQPGTLIFDAQHQKWLQILSKAGFALFDKSATKNKSNTTVVKISPLWPPKPSINTELKTSQLEPHRSPSELQLRNLYTVSGLNYHAKRQIFVSVIAKQHRLVKVKMLPPDERELILLPLRIDKEHDGSSCVKVFNIDTAEILQLNVGQLATVSELELALVDEPLADYLLQK